MSAFTHENKGNEFLIYECNKPTKDGTTMLQLTTDWLSQVSLHLITPMPYLKHEYGSQIKEPTRAY